MEKFQTSIFNTSFIHETTNKKNITENHTNEYYRDITLVIIENNILQMINILRDVDLSKASYIKYNMFGVLQNIIIINSNKLRELYYKNNFTIIKKAIYSLPDKYNKMVLLNMFDNIVNSKSYNNINYRHIEPIITKYPPISAEERICIEQQLPQFRRSKQYKKNPNIFKVDEIVGVKSDENKWNMGRVLHNYTDESTGYDWYYVKIEGMSNTCNFWVNSITYRIQKFKPHKHLLYK